MKKVILAFMTGLCLVVYGLLIFDVGFTPARASRSNYLDFDEVNEESQVIISEGSTSIALFAEDGSLYETQGAGAAGAAEFLSQDPKAGESSLLPTGFQEDARASRFIEDESGESHYFYQQTIDGIPVYGSQLAVHQRNNNEIYSLTGNITNASYVFKGPLTKEGAEKIALDEASKETSARLRVERSEQIVFNGRALGVSDDPSNYLSWAVTVRSVTEEVMYGSKFIINTSSGDILFREETVHEALDRKIYTCDESTNCSQSRFEGQPATGKKDVDLAYDTYGSYYAFLKDNFQRDSFDNQGGSMFAYMYFRDQTCPNAWMDHGKVYVCSGLAAKDVITHEMTHAMNQSGPRFVYANQSGALDESVADIFASAIDGNYTMGEDTQLGIIRSMEDPGSHGQPDRLFSPNYWCSVQDNGGVHKNGGVVGKAFHLMAQGGTFNTCTVTGIGQDKAYAIMYKATTSYLRSSSNFKDVYNAVIQACGDLYGGANSATCIQVRNSMRSTEMDQQTEGSQKGPKCENKQAQKPDCTVEPVDPAATATPTPANAPTGAVPTPTKTPAVTQNATVNLTLRLQGVFSKPSPAKPLNIEVKLAGSKLKETITKQAVFEWQSNGTVKGKLDFNQLPAGDGYSITVKPPLHLARKICDSGAVEIFEGKYTCYGQSLTLKGGENTVDAQGILQIAGDLPDENNRQDNIINSYDIGLVRNNMGKTEPSILGRADINYDGMINQQDLNIINLSSTVKLD